jgi:ubiquinone/menaquinone biosynthesis C-methylase UbiE
MGEDRFDFDPREWHNVQSADEMDVSRYFEYDDDALFQLRKWLRLDQSISKTIVEVGCGSGYFTEKLVTMASALKEIAAIEPDDTLREYAQKKLSSVKCLKGLAEDIPLPEEFADLTVCHIVLSNLPDVVRAVGEMVRVTKKGGIVAAIEPGEARMYYSPNPQLDEMEEKIIQAFGKGIWDLRGRLIDYSKDLKKKNARYPEVFHQCGLTDIEAHGILSVFLLSDSRRDLQGTLSWLKLRQELFEKYEDRNKVILQRGGLSEQFIQSYNEARSAQVKNLIEHPEEIRKTHELQTYSRTITIGFKP